MSLNDLRDAVKAAASKISTTDGTLADLLDRARSLGSERSGRDTVQSIGSVAAALARFSAVPGVSDLIVCLNSLAQKMTQELSQSRGR